MSTLAYTQGHHVGIVFSLSLMKQQTYNFNFTMLKNEIAVVAKPQSKLARQRPAPKTSFPRAL